MRTCHVTYHIKSCVVITSRKEKHCFEGPPSHTQATALPAFPTLLTSCTINLWTSSEKCKFDSVALQWGEEHWNPHQCKLGGASCPRCTMCSKGYPAPNKSHGHAMLFQLSFEKALISCHQKLPLYGFQKACKPSKQLSSLNEYSVSTVTLSQSWPQGPFKVKSFS